MGVNKIEYGGDTLIDLTEDSVTPQTLAEGETAHNAAGEEITGTLKVQDEIVVTTGSSTAYEATVRGITELKAGVSFIMIPHETSSYAAPTLNVNELGAKSIRRRTSDGKSIVNLSVFNFFTKDKPYRLMYDGTYWMVVDYSKPSATDLDGKIPIDKIATSADNKGKVLTTNDNGVAEWQEPSGGSGGNTLKPSEGLEYEALFEIPGGDPTSYKVIGIGTCTDNFVIIPSKHEGLPVTYIGEYAFGHPVYSDEAPTFTKIFIPKSVTGGMYEAFANNVSVKTIYCEAETMPDDWYPFWQPANAEVIWGYKLEGEDDKTSAMPTIRFSNAFDNNGSWIIDESNPINFTVEVMSGKVQEGDLLQICVRRMYKKNDRKIWRLRRFTEKELSSEDIGQQFLSISAYGGEPAERWLFKNDRNSSRTDTKSSIYLRIKRVTKYDQNGEECNAIFSNIVEINKAFNHSTFKVAIK